MQGNNPAREFFRIYEIFNLQRTGTKGGFRDDPRGAVIQDDPDPAAPIRLDFTYSDHEGISSRRAQ